MKSEKYVIEKVIINKIECMDGSILATLWLEPESFLYVDEMGVD
jgi:hypothetical protein